jgi:hypothetical protein
MGKFNVCVCMHAHTCTHRDLHILEGTLQYETEVVRFQPLDAPVPFLATVHQPSLNCLLCPLPFSPSQAAPLTPCHPPDLHWQEEKRAKPVVSSDITGAFPWDAGLRTWGLGRGAPHYVTQGPVSLWVPKGLISLITPESLLSQGQF